MASEDLVLATHRLKDEEDVLLLLTAAYLLHLEALPFWEYLNKMTTNYSTYSTQSEDVAIVGASKPA